MTRCVLLAFDSENATEVRCEDMDAGAFERIAAAVVSAALAGGADPKRLLRLVQVGAVLTPAEEPIVIE